jgi:hypothetical protein
VLRLVRPPLLLPDREHLLDLPTEFLCAYC